MTQTINVSMTLYASSCSTVELPAGHVAENIRDWYVKWDIFHYTLDGQVWYEIELHSAGLDTVDWKRPSYTELLDQDFESIDFPHCVSARD